MVLLPILAPRLKLVRLCPLVIHAEANLNGVTVQERKIRFGLPSPQRCQENTPLP